MSSLISLRLGQLSYSDLKKLAQAIHDGFVANVADYPTPVPAMLILQGQITTLDDAITAWGPPEARGSRSQHDALKAAAKAVRSSLRQLAAYAVATMPDNPDSWRLLKFAIKRAKTKPVKLQAVQNFHRFISRDIPEGLIRLKWERPLAAEPFDVKSYIIQVSNVGVQPPLPDGHAVINNGITALSPNTSVIVQPPFVGGNYFWVTPLNTIGYGVSSEPVYYNAPGKP